MMMLLDRILNQSARVTFDIPRHVEMTLTLFFFLRIAELPEANVTLSLAIEYMLRIDTCSLVMITRPFKGSHHKAKYLRIYIWPS